ncbi:hypothetical protein GF420_06935 [candidate division GN15 bacterium]|nr:hypothetical protein [candidate division GN15 bacterium]
MSRYHRETLIIAVTTIAVRLAYQLYTGFTADDAFITFRYAENIANGLGFVYNEGQRVLGTTTPLYGLIMAVASFFKFPLPGAALVVSLAASATTAVVIYRFAVALRFRLLAFVPVICYILWPRSLPGETAGMETALFTLLVISAFYFRHRRYDYYAIGMATLATLTRPEGAFLLLLLIVAETISLPQRWWQYLLVPAFLILPWVIFATFYFGSPIPHTVEAKAALYSQFGTMTGTEALTYLLALHTPFGWLLAGLVIAGAIWLYRSQRSGLLMLIWLTGIIAFYALSPTRLFFWYVVPIYPIYLLFATAAGLIVWDRLPLKIQHSVSVRTALGIALAALLVVGAYRPLQFYRNYQQALESMHLQVGYYLFAEANPDHLVAAEDIGYIGFYSKRTILDRDGLVSPEVVPYNRIGNYLQLLLDYRPEWVVAAEPSATSPFLDDSTFIRRYRLERSFSTDEIAYHVYSRKVSQPDTTDSGAN